MPTMHNQLNGQTCRIKFYPGLGFAPMVDKNKESLNASAKEMSGCNLES